ncbi:MAG: signal peptidase I [Bacilli bacterium]|nr:signal peptidase I [Bacilli bacterium]
MKFRKKSFIEKIINYLLDVLIFVFGFILLITIYTGIQTKVLGNDYNNFFGYSIFEVQTGSMADTINAGDWVIVELAPKVKLNDIITYKLGSEYITHRVVEVYKGTYITKGDANSGKDEPIDQKQVVGKVVKVLSNLGIIRKTIFNVSVLITVFITIFLFNLAFKRSKKENYKESTVRLDRGKTIYSIFEEISIRIGLFIEKIREFMSNKRTKNNYRSGWENNDLVNYDRIYDFDKFKNEEVIEDELGKTAIFRVISVDADEVDDKYKEQPTDEIIIEEEKEDELEKTAFFRVVSVDADEVDDKFKKQPAEEIKAEKEKEDKLIKTVPSRAVSATIVEEEDKSKELTQVTNDEETLEDELSKTSVFRVIPVDASELDDTFLEIAKNEIKEAEQSDKNKKEAINLETKTEATDDDEDNETLTKINLDLLKGKKGSEKGNNIINTAMLIKRGELNELISVLLRNNKSHANKASIKNMFIKTYIDVKYYNFNDDKDINNSGRNLISKIKRVIKELATKLINDYKGSDNKYNDTVETYASTFILIANLEQARDSITELKAKREFYKKEIKKCFKVWDIEEVAYVTEEIIKIQGNYINTLEYFFQKFETNMFDLNINRLAARRNMYGLELNHNISFSRVYSDYIIDKTYTEGIVAEDKIIVLLTLLSVQLIKDMILSNFNRKYVLYIPDTLYTKERKLNKLLRMIDDEYAKDNIIILLTYEDLLSNKQIIKKIRKMGYKFALVFSKETVIKEKDRSNLYIVNYIFVNKKDDNMTRILSFIPDELLDNVIYEDIIEKVGDLGSDK